MGSPAVASLIIHDQAHKQMYPRQFKSVYQFKSTVSVDCQFNTDSRFRYFCLSNAMHGQNIYLPVCVCLSVCLSVCLCVRHTFCQLAYRSDPSTDFYSW